MIKIYHTLNSKIPIFTKNNVLEFQSYFKLNINKNPNLQITIFTKKLWERDFFGARKNLG
jgi:hypothetical protein